MWISFDCPSAKKYAIRPYVGGINGISGESMMEKLSRPTGRLDDLTDKQDYLVLPRQARLDGVATKSGVVKQFIATQRIPSADQAARFLAGEVIHVNSGLTEGQRHSKNHEIADISIEWQMSGKGNVGGIQLQFIPEHNIEHMRFSNTPNHILENGHLISHFTPAPSNAKSFDLFKNPSEQNIDIGDTLHVKDTKDAQPERLKTVKDLWFESPFPLNSTEDIELDIFYRAPSVRLFAVHLPDATLAPIFFEVSGN